MSGTGTQVAVRTIAHAAGHTSDADFADDALGAVASVLPYDGYVLFGVDPESRLRSFVLARNSLDGIAADLAYNENIERDVNRYEDLARAAVPAAVLGGGAWEPPSPRLHEILRPAGFRSELRLAIRSGRTQWGALTLFRTSRRRAFSADDASLATTIAPALGTALRLRPLRPMPSPASGLPAGVVLLDHSNRIVAIGHEARAWLQDMCAGGSDEMNVEDMARVVFDVAHAARTKTGEHQALCRIRTATGRWVAVQGSRIDAYPADVAVILQPAGLTQLLPAIQTWLGLTPREAQVLQLAATGIPGKHIARQLQLSQLTVNTHLRSVYRKADVTGRDELIGRLT